MDNSQTPLVEVLAEARAIRHAAQYGIISYQEAKAKAQPLLDQVNIAGKLIAKKYKRKFRTISFSDL